MPRFPKVLVKMPHNLLSASMTMMPGRPNTEKNWENVKSASTLAVMGFPNCKASDCKSEDSAF
jgi:hypothetical protein